MNNDETQIQESQDYTLLLYILSEDFTQVVLGLIHSIETRWTAYENNEIYSISTLLDPEVSFSTSALARAKKLLLTLMRRVNADEARSGTDDETCIVSNNENAEAGLAEKKSHWDSFEEDLKNKKAGLHLVT